MWVELVTQDEGLRDNLFNHCRELRDHWASKTYFLPNERPFLCKFYGVLVFDVRSASAEEWQHLCAEEPSYIGPTLLITDDLKSVNENICDLPQNVKIDIIPSGSSMELFKLRIAYVQQEHLVWERNKAIHIDQVRAVTRYQNLRDILDGAPFLLLSLDRMAHLHDANAVARKFFGDDQALFTGDGWTRYLHDNDRHAFVSNVRAACKEPHTFCTVLRLCRFDKVWRWMSVSAGPIVDPSGAHSGVALLLTDITEQRKLDDALRERESNLRELAESLPILIWRADSNLRFDYLNSAWERYTGVAAESLLRDGLNQIMAPTQLKTAREQFAMAVKTGEPFNFEVRILEKKSGNYTWHRAQGVPIKNGHVRRWFGSFVVIDSIKRKSDRAAQLYKELLEINRVKDHLLGAFPEEARSSVMRMLGQRIALLDMHKLSCEDRMSLDAISRGAHLLLRHINDLLDLSYMMTGRMELQRAPAHLATIIREVLEEEKDMWGCTNITLSTHLDENLKPVLIDANKIKQVLRNVLTNAMNFTPADGWVKVTLCREENDAVFAVSDSGEGVSAEFLPRIFDPFAQEENYLTRRQGGLGLGLALAKHIVDLHGGSISAACPGKGQGLRIEIRMPLAG